MTWRTTTLAGLVSWTPGIKRRRRKDQTLESSPRKSWGRSPPGTPVALVDPCDSFARCRRQHFGAQVHLQYYLSLLLVCRGKEQPVLLGPVPWATSSSLSEPQNLENLQCLGASGRTAPCGNRQLNTITCASWGGLWMEPPQAGLDLTSANSCVSAAVSTQAIRSALAW